MDAGLILLCIAICVTGWAIGHRICVAMGWD